MQDSLQQEENVENSEPKKLKKKIKKKKRQKVSNSSEGNVPLSLMGFFLHDLFCSFVASFATNLC